MKPNELMIGDLVYSPLHCERVRITGVMEHGNLCYVESLKGTDFYSKEANANDFEPIEIDAEMLMQNGFREDRPGITYRYRKTGETTIDMVDVFFHNNGETTVGVNQTTYGAYDTSVHCHCKYVHELQHILRLCGIIKQLKLG